MAASAGRCLLELFSPILSLLRLRMSESSWVINVDQLVAREVAGNIFYCAMLPPPCPRCQMLMLLLGNLSHRRERFQSSECL
ncbi:unnamed protein product [Urochloa humidicola]